MRERRGEGERQKGGRKGEGRGGGDGGRWGGERGDGRRRIRKVSCTAVVGTNQNASHQVSE